MFDLSTCFDLCTAKALPDRIDYFTQQFLGRPYVGSAQGEGSQGEFDQSPLFRFDAFDCVTYVNNVLALALSSNAAEFQNHLLKINYYNGIPKYENRFHFMSVDWNLQNQKNNIVRDVTEEMGSAIVAYAEGEIDRPNWFAHRNMHDIKLYAEHNIEERVQALRQMADYVLPEWVRLPYLPLEKLLANNAVFEKIPHAAIIEIVRPNWDLRDKIGTHLHISHIGFAVRHDGELFFRHATSEKKCVVEVLLRDYLKQYLQSETVKGIHVQSAVIPK